MALMTITQFFKNLEMCHVFVFLTWEKIPNTSAQCDVISNSLSHLDTMQFFYVPEEFLKSIVQKGNTRFLYFCWNLARMKFFFPFHSLKPDSIKPDSVHISSITICFIVVGLNCILNCLTSKNKIAVPSTVRV